MNELSQREYEIELKVERMTDRLDRRYMRGDLTSEQYKAEMDAIAEWANQQYDQASNG